MQVEWGARCRWSGSARLSGYSARLRYPSVRVIAYDYFHDGQAWLTKAQRLVGMVALSQSA